MPILWFVVWVAFWTSVMTSPVRLQDDPHARGHNEYLNWSSQKTGNCCNEQDCRPLEPSEWRETEQGTDIKIMDVWCPVLQEHFIIRGKSPDGSAPHACVRKYNYVDEYNEASPCRLLLCFVGESKS